MSSSFGPGNQRRAARVRVHLPAKYVSSNLHAEGNVTDVSPDGLFFCSDFLDDQGEAALISVEVPSQARTLELRGEVRWVNDAPHAGGMGIRLIDVSLEDQALLAELTAQAASAAGSAARARHA